MLFLFLNLIYCNTFTLFNKGDFYIDFSKEDEYLLKCPEPKTVIYIHEKYGYEFEIYDIDGLKLYNFEQTKNHNLIDFGKQTGFVKIRRKKVCFPYIYISFTTFSLLSYNIDSCLILSKEKVSFQNDLPNCIWALIDPYLSENVYLDSYDTSYYFLSLSTPNKEILSPSSISESCDIFGWTCHSRGISFNSGSPIIYYDTDITRKVIFNWQKYYDDCVRSDFTLKVNSETKSYDTSINQDNSDPQWVKFLEDKKADVFYAPKLGNLNIDMSKRESIIIVFEKELSSLVIHNKDGFKSKAYKSDGTLLNEKEDLRIFDFGKNTGVIHIIKTSAQLTLISISSISYSQISSMGCNKLRFISSGGYNNFLLSSAENSNRTYLNSDEVCIWFTSPYKFSFSATLNSEFEMDNLYLYYQNNNSMLDYQYRRMTGTEQFIITNLSSIFMRWKTDESTIANGFFLLSLSNNFDDNKYITFTQKYEFNDDGYASNDNLTIYDPPLSTLSNLNYFSILIVLIAIIIIIIGLYFFYIIFIKKNEYQEYRFEQRSSLENQLV